MLDSELAVFGVGVAGGAANELLHWWGLLANRNFSHYASRAFYWILTLGMVVLGGTVASSQLGAHADALIVFEIGLVAPMSLQKLIKATPEHAGAKVSTGPSVHDFMRG